MVTSGDTSDPGSVTVSRVSRVSKVRFRVRVRLGVRVSDSV